MLVDAAKIDNVGAHLMLAAELEAEKSARTEVGPKRIFGIALFAAESSRIMRASG